MASNKHLCLIKSHILRKSDKLRLLKTMVEDKNLKLSLLQCGIV